MQLHWKPFYLENKSQDLIHEVKAVALAALKLKKINYSELVSLRRFSGISKETYEFIINKTVAGAFIDLKKLQD
jgi:hypothetical protein